MYFLVQDFSPQTDESHKQKVCKNSCFIVLEKELGSVQNFFDRQNLNNWDPPLSCQTIKATLSNLLIYARCITCLKQPFSYC